MNEEEIKNEQFKIERNKITSLVQSRLTESKQHFLSTKKDRFDHFYRNFRSDGSERFEKLKKIGGEDWMSNLFVPLTSSSVRTIQPRVIDSKPDFRIEGRTEKDKVKAVYANGYLDYLWEKASMDSKMRDFVWTALVYGTAVGKAYWHTEKQIKTDKVYNEKELKIDDVIIENKIFDDPDYEVVDLYNFYPDPLATGINNARYFCHRYVMTFDQIITSYGNLEEGPTEIVKNKGGGGDVRNYGNVRVSVNSAKEINKSSDSTVIGSPSYGAEPDITSGLYEVIEYWEKNRFVLSVAGVVLRDGPNPFGIGVYPFTLARYETLPFEFYGIGLVEQVEQPQKTLNTIRSQRLDNNTLRIQQMFIANPYSLVSQNDLVARPFGIIRTTDMNAIRALEVPDIHSSAFKEDDIAIRTGGMATGIDDWSRGMQGPASATATAVTTQKESTLERVKIFVRTLESDVYAPLTRYWIAMAHSLSSTEKLKRITDNGEVEEKDDMINVPINIKTKDGDIKTLISKDDLLGLFDFKVSALSTLSATKELKIQKILNYMDKIVVAGRDSDGSMVPSVREAWIQLVKANDWDPDIMLNPPKTDIIPPQGQVGQVGQVGQEVGNKASAPSSNELMNNIMGEIGMMGKTNIGNEGSKREGPLPKQGIEMQKALQLSK